MWLFEYTHLQLDVCASQIEVAGTDITRLKFTDLAIVMSCPYSQLKHEIVPVEYSKLPLSFITVPRFQTTTQARRIDPLPL